MSSELPKSLFWVHELNGKNTEPLLELDDFLLKISDDIHIKWASFKCLPSPFINGANNLTARSSFFTYAQGNLEFKTNKIIWEQPFDLNESHPLIESYKNTLSAAVDIKALPLSTVCLNYDRLALDGNASSTVLCLLAFCGQG